MISVEEVVNDQDVAQIFTILRSTNGKFVSGIWTTDQVSIPSYGPIRPATPRDLEMVPEGDKVKEVKIFWSAQPIYATHATDGIGGSSDLLQWKQLYYRVLSVTQSQDWGFYRAVAVRTKAS
jgi:hypothetical protein